MREDKREERKRLQWSRTCGVMPPMTSLPDRKSICFFVCLFSVFLTVLYSLSWPQTHHAPEDGLQFLTFSPLQPEGRDCWPVPPGLAKSRCFYEKEMHDNKIR